MGSEGDGAVATVTSFVGNISLKVLLDCIPTDVQAHAPALPELCSCSWAVQSRVTPEYTAHKFFNFVYLPGVGFCTVHCVGAQSGNGAPPSANDGVERVPTSISIAIAKPASFFTM